MPTVEIGLTLTFRTPPSVGAGGASGTLADKVITRNARGQFIIPASQLKGKLRHACEQLLRARDAPLCRPPHPDRMCPQVEEDGGRPLPMINEQPLCLLCQVFGAPSRPSRLRFHDLVALRADLPHETLRPMVSLNRHRRTAEEQRLFLVETAPHLGSAAEGLEFGNSTAITGDLDDRSHLHLLLAGFKLIFTWGGGSSRGLGWGEVTWQVRLGDESLGKIEVSKEEVEKLCPSSR